MIKGIMHRKDSCCAVNNDMHMRIIACMRNSPSDFCSTIIYLRGRLDRSDHRSLPFFYGSVTIHTRHYVILNPGRYII